MTTLSLIKQYALEDIKDALSKVKSKIKVIDVSYDVDGDIEVGEGSVFVTFTLGNDKQSFEQNVDYIVDESGNIYAGYDSIDGYADSIEEKCESAGITASTHIKPKRRIVAADEDEFEEEDPLEGEIGETLEGIADDVNDMQDEIEDVTEDDPNIEVDNNIEGKYIAECERCHGIFISAVSESDQDVESISGTCPLCEHDTTQWLNWVIKAVDR